MHVSKLERWWLRIGVVMLVAFLTTVGVDAFVLGAGNSHGMDLIAPDRVSQTAPFDHPGTSRNKDGSWDAVVVAYAFGFLPREDLVVPAGVEVHFRVASVDVVHGFQIPGKSNVNLEVLPGHVSEVTQTFDEPGRYLVLCDEYCGSGHHFMTTHIKVLPKGAVPDQESGSGAAKPASSEHDMAGMEDHA